MWGSYRLLRHASMVASYCRPPRSTKYTPVTGCPAQHGALSVRRGRRVTSAIKSTWPSGRFARREPPRPAANEEPDVGRMGFKVWHRFRFAASI
jgi:hypothetical protein